MRLRCSAHPHRRPYGDGYKPEEALDARATARLLAETTVPSTLSLVIRSDAPLLDGTPRDRAIDTIDDETSPTAVSAVRERNPAARRIVGIDANTSTRRPKSLRDRH